MKVFFDKAQSQILGMDALNKSAENEVTFTGEYKGLPFTCGEGIGFAQVETRNNDGKMIGFRHVENPTFGQAKSLLIETANKPGNNRFLLFPPSRLDCAYRPGMVIASNEQLDRWESDQFHGGLSGVHARTGLPNDK